MYNIISSIVSFIHSNVFLLLNDFVSIVEVILNTVAVIIIFKGVVTALYTRIITKSIDRHLICKSISAGLNYNLATETLKIIVGPDLNDMLIIGAILILKLLITILFLLEIKQDEMQLTLEQKKHN